MDNIRDVVDTIATVGGKLRPAKGLIAVKPFVGRDVSVSRENYESNHLLDDPHRRRLRAPHRPHGLVVVDVGVLGGGDRVRVGVADVDGWCCQ